MKKIFIITTCMLSLSFSRAAFLHNDYSYLQDITFEMYTDEVPAYKVPEQIKSIEETLMFEVLHATWKDKHWVAYTLNKNLLGTFKVGQPALLDNGDTKKLYFIAGFPGSVGGLDLYVSEYSKGAWSKPKNLGKNVNTEKNESNPGLLNDHTLTYSSGGIIKKLDINTLQVVDLEESGIGEKTTKAEEKKEVNPVRDPLAPIDNTSTPAATETKTNPSVQPVQNTYEKPVAVTPQAPKETPAPVQNSSASNFSSTVEFLGNKSREEMLSRYKTAIQLGAFSTPKWELFDQFSKYGKLVSYKNDKNMSVVWITGFNSRAAADAALSQVKSTMGFENAYITGK